jgi:hypothetical protein
MSELLDDTWASRDLPVLKAIAALLDQTPGQPLFMDDLCAAVADLVSAEDVARAVTALHDAQIVEAGYEPPRGGAARLGGVRSISGEGRRLVGMWPTPETALDRMLAALEQIEATSDDPAKRGRARQLRDGLLGAGRDLAVEVIAATITRQTGLAGGS